MKTLSFKLLLLLLSGIILNSCKTDFDLNAPYKESVAIYGLLSQSDSVNYIRVNKVFLGEGDATLFAQIKDSVYFKPGELSVSVEKYFNGIKKQTYIFSETYEKVLNPGSFNPDQLIYKTTQAFKSDSANKEFDYHLIVKNNVSGKIYTSRTSLVHDLTSASCSNIASGCFLNLTNVNLAVSSPGLIKIKFGSPVNARVCNLLMRFYYHDSLFSGGIVPRHVDLNFSNKKTSTLLGAEVLDFSFPADVYYKTIASSIVDDPSVVKCRKADSVNFYIVSGGEFLNLYNEINGTSGSFGQEKPIYTNIDNDAVGVFSARYTKKINKPYYSCTGGPTQTGVITYQSLDQLALGPHTCHLRFTKSDCSINSFCP
ncbi:MAG: hypothetical protein ACJ76F_14335 [Bacteroidia bacterium]